MATILYVEELNNELNRYCGYKDDISEWSGDLLGVVIPDKLKEKIIQTGDKYLLAKMKKAIKDNGRLDGGF